MIVELFLGTLFGGIALAMLAWSKKIQVMAYGATGFLIVAAFVSFSMSVGLWDLYFLGGWMIMGFAISCGVEALGLKSQMEEDIIRDLEQEEKEEDAEERKQKEKGKVYVPRRRPNDNN